jgi:pSer/pThr/pTyr-binding forkhead associated (FHA) protein
MADKALPPKDLTSTLTLRQLRAIPSEGKSKEFRDQLSTQDQEVVNSLPKDSAILIVLKGPGSGSRFLINSANIKIGRELSNDISLDDITVSRSHAAITKNNDLVIRDLGSLNGTYINAVAVREQVLSDGDEIQIGKFHLTLFIGDK